MVDPLDGTSFDPLLLVSNLPPALQQTLSLHPHVVAERVPASRLLTPCRMDVAYKFVLARQIASVGASDYGIRQYLDHMRVVSASVAGDDPRGAVTDSLVAQFTDTICSIRRHGFDPNRAVILNRAGDIIDGSHRVAACLALGTPVVAVSTDSDLRYDLSASRFRRSETRTEQAHEALLQYVKNNADVRLVLLWPGAEALDEARVAPELLEHHEVVDEGRIVVSRALGRALGRQLGRAPGRALGMAARSTEPWLSGSSHDDAGARDGLVTCSRHPEGVLRYYVVQRAPRSKGPEADLPRRLGVDDHPVHVTDAHPDTVRVAEILLHAGTRSFHEVRRDKRMPMFEELTGRLRQQASSGAVDLEHLILVGSAPLAAYGVRDVRDLDFVGLPDPARDAALHEIAEGRSDTPDATGRPMTAFLYDPADYFYLDGIKLLSLPRLRAFKARRDTPKDRDDLASLARLEASKASLLTLRAFTPGALTARLRARAHRMRYRVRMARPGIWDRLRRDSGRTG